MTTCAIDPPPSPTALPLVAGAGAWLINLTLLLLVRQGLELPFALIGLCGLFVAAQLLATCALARLAVAPLWRVVLQTAVFWLLSIAVLVLQTVPVPLVVLLGLVAAVSAGRLLRRRADPRTGLAGSLIVTLVILLIGLTALAGYQHRELQTHFLMPEFLDLGILHKDPTGFASLVALIARGEIPGGVLDGVQPFLYHYGSLYFMAALARLTGETPIMCQLAAHQLVFLPLMLFHLAAAASAWRQPASAPASEGLCVPLALALLFVLAGATWPIAFYSESMAASMPVLFLFLHFLRAWLDPGVPPRSRLLALAALLPLFLLTLLVKITTGFMLLAFAGYLGLSLLLAPRRRLAALVYLLGCAALVAGALIHSWPTLRGIFERWAWSAVENLPPVATEAGAAVMVLLALALVPLLLRRLDSASVASARTLPTASFPLWFAAAVAGGAVIASVQLLYNARYLFNSLTLAAIPPLSAAVTMAISSLARPFAERLPRPRWLGALLLLVAFPALLEPTRLQPTDAWEQIDTASRMLCRAAGASCREDAGLLQRRFPVDIVQAIQDGPGARLVEQAAWLAAEGAEAFFVPEDADTVWAFLLSGDRPQENLPLLPAQLGRPMLLGLPPARYGVDLVIINASHPGTYGEAARSRPIDDQTLCRHARSLGITTIGVLSELGPSDANRLLLCAH